MPPFKVLTATHDDGEKPKRFGYKAPAFDAWLEIFLQDEMPDQIVGILLNLNSDEVQELKSCIRHELRFRAVTFPGLFKEPSSIEDYRKEWNPNVYGCYPVVPHQFRREILARLVDICADEMKKDKNLRAGATDPTPLKREHVCLE
ncbi:unnamed protein product [Aureobasidium uvarum]|uniref:Uncharacterized protein n=1 Tax=Aureobasidium uvarum TaxID=2773716 RepID=A0A9N8KYH6_9PEZI|nr:unnamed protein product [Aureobasidium uvarum]